MEKIRCAVVDDEPLALGLMASYVKKTPFLELVGSYSSAVQAMQEMHDNPVDLIFLDIQMPELNGLDYSRMISPQTRVVFTTAYSEYAVEGFKINAVDYLLKPFGLDDFRRAANRLKERIEAVPQTSAPTPTTSHPSPIPSDDDDSIFVKTDYKVIKIAISDIRYVEAMSEYLKIHLDSQPKPIITLLSMKKMEERLPDYFMRIHRSYIINLKQIQEVNKNRVIMDADTYLPIGDNYRDAFNDYLNKKFLGK